VKYLKAGASLLLAAGCIWLMKSDILMFWTALASCIFGFITLYILIKK